MTFVIFFISLSVRAIPAEKSFLIPFVKLSTVFIASGILSLFFETF